MIEALGSVDRLLASLRNAIDIRLESLAKFGAGDTLRPGSAT